MDLPGRAVDDEHAAREGHEGARAGRIEIEGREARRAHAKTLTEDSLLGRERLRAAREQRLRRREHAHRAARDVHLEERLLGIARCRSQEEDSLRVRRQRGLSGYAEMK